MKKIAIFLVGITGQHRMADGQPMPAPNHHSIFRRDLINNHAFLFHYMYADANPI